MSSMNLTPEEFDAKLASIKLDIRYLIVAFHGCNGAKMEASREIGKCLQEVLRNTNSDRFLGDDGGLDWR